MAKGKVSLEGEVRWGWLKFMYLYTIVGAGLYGLGMVFAPRLAQSMSGFPAEDPVVFGIVGSVYVSFGVLSILGFRSPLKFTPVLLLQLFYKSIWLVCVALPLFLKGGLEQYAITLVIIFATYIIGDLIAIPFRYLFRKQ
jgi:hypothetical protein